MGPPVAQLRPRNSGLDFFWRIILCARVYTLGLMDRVRFRGAAGCAIRSAFGPPDPACHTGTQNHAEIKKGSVYTVISRL